MPELSAFFEICNVIAVIIWVTCLHSSDHRSMPAAVKAEKQSPFPRILRADRSPSVGESRGKVDCMNDRYIKALTVDWSRERHVVSTV